MKPSLTLTAWEETAKAVKFRDMVLQNVSRHRLQFCFSRAAWIGLVRAFRQMGKRLLTKGTAFSSAINVRALDGFSL
jgi:hypothetical protein